MGEHFKSQLKGKTRKELEDIVHSHHGYQEGAVKAAILLLKEEHGIILPLPFKERKENAYVKDVFTYKKYFLTFSYRELTSALVLSFLFITVFKCLRYFQSVPFVEENFSLLVLVLSIVVCLMSHVFYKREHKRRNLFLGRIVQDVINLLFILSALLFMAWTKGYRGPSPKIDLFLSFIGFVVGIILVEGILSIVRRVLKMFGWHIW